jgi:hypothetical protein
VAKSLEQRATATTEHKNVASERISAQAFLHQERQALHALAHIGVICGDPDPNARGDRDHGSAREVTVTRAVDAVASMRTRTPPARSTVIASAEGMGREWRACTKHGSCCRSW